MKTKKRVILGLLIIALIASGAWGVSRIVRLRPAGSDTLSAEDPGEGVGRNPAVIRYLGAPEAEEIGTAFYFDTYTEGEGPAPEWYDPTEPMAAEWRESCRQVQVQSLRCERPVVFEQDLHKITAQNHRFSFIIH